MKPKMPKLLPTPEQFRTLLAAYIKRHKLTTRTAGDKLGVSNASISNWLNGKGKPGRFFLTHLPPLLRK